MRRALENQSARLFRAVLSPSTTSILQRHQWPKNQMETKMQKRGKKDKHFSERGIITQPFSRVIIGLQGCSVLYRLTAGVQRSLRTTHRCTPKRSCQLQNYLYLLSGTLVDLRYPPGDPGKSRGLQSGGLNRMLPRRCRGGLRRPNL